MNKAYNFNSSSTFKEKELCITTLVLVALGLSMSFDEDSAVLLYASSGLIYSLALLFTMNANLNFWRTALGVLILTISGFYILFASAPIALLPIESKDTHFWSFSFYLLPSLSGALITLLVLKYLWKVKIYKLHWLLLTCSMTVASLLTTLIIIFSGESNYAKHFSISLNSLFWWLAFSFSLLYVQSHANKFKN